MLVGLPGDCIDNRHTPVDDIQQSNIFLSTDLFTEITGSFVGFLFRFRQIVVDGADPAVRHAANQHPPPKTRPVDSGLKRCASLRYGAAWH